MCAIIELYVQFPARHTNAAARRYLEGNHPTLRQKWVFCPNQIRATKLRPTLKPNNLPAAWDNLSEEVSVPLSEHRESHL